ncbi:MAG TPA: hypothetical protein VFR90_03255 [Methylibium sp.]|uniref:hypothetical protein n=1 Tax=Methylibium sp. TaxID=2067992 RepID=UPI002DB6125F|nr:hypothetical protein [Methylibium sp.]HEU4458118.1 hypothetical protein [Methylibium sp.]
MDMIAPDDALARVLRLVALGRLSAELGPPLEQLRLERVRDRGARPGGAVHFAWRGGRNFEIDGQPFSAKGIGVVLAWMALTSHTRRISCIEPAAVFPAARRPDAVALQAIQRAAMHVPEPLAGCMQTIGTAGGRLAVKGKLPCNLVCSSPELVKAVTEA